MAKKSLEEIEKLRKQVSPTTFLEELAQSDYLYEYVLNFLNKEFENDPKVREEILYLLYKYSKSPILELDVFFLEELNSILDNFIQKINKK